jgi:hypothetical protein
MDIELVMKRLCALPFLVLPLPAFATCPADLALYSNVEGGAYSMSLLKQAEPKAWSDIEITITGPDANLRYELTASNGYSRNYLVPIPLLAQDDEKEGANIVFFDKDLKVLNLPQAGTPAPEYIFSADLGVQLYYSTNTTNKPVTIPTGMWKLSGCAE